jgi:hypothetical protein
VLCRPAFEGTRRRSLRSERTFAKSVARLCPTRRRTSRRSREDLLSPNRLGYYTVSRLSERPDRRLDPRGVSFMRSAPDIATAVYLTGIDPFTKQEVYVAKGLRDRKMQRALMQFFKPENYFTVREALIQAGRADLIGNGCDCLIPAHPPKDAIEARRRRANEAVRGDHYHTVANPAKGEPAGERGLPNKGYRPGRKTGRRQNRQRRRNHE